MELNLNKTQLEIIEYDEPEMLIRGVAGSGKTICLLFNAISKAMNSSGLYFFTFNKTLEKYINDIVTTESIENIEVATFHGWARTKLKSIYPKVSILSKKNVIIQILEKAIKLASAEYSGRFITNSKLQDFLLDEFTFINQQYIKNLEEYINVARVGRGSMIRLSKEDREEIYNIYTHYQLEKSKKNLFEFVDFAPKLLDNFDKVDSTKEMRHIYIDEAQDLDKAQLLILSRLAQKTFYVAADKGQKIYSTSYSWKEIGVNILGGRTKVLETSYRTTEQILRLARSLQTKDIILDDEEFTEAQIEDMRIGPMPEVITFEKTNYRKIFVDEVKNALLNNEVIGILVNSWYEGNKLARYLNEAGIVSDLIKGEKGSSLLPGVKITTMHSSKGLEFDHVIIPDFSYERYLDFEDEDNLNVFRRLYYVSFTRARNRLTIFVPNESESYFFAEIDKELYIQK